MQLKSIDDEESLISWQSSSLHHRNPSTGEEFTQKVLISDTQEPILENLTQQETGIDEEKATAAAPKISESKELNSLSNWLLDHEKGEEPLVADEHCIAPELDNSLDDHEQGQATTISGGKVVQRVESCGKLKSLQLGKQLSCKWTTGAGPRIGCVRNHPPELQFRALEEVNLSPRSAQLLRPFFSPRSTSVLSPVAKKIENDDAKSGS